jgi:gamma-glutamylcysteine synthetase
MDALDQLKSLPPGAVPPQVILKLLPLPQDLRNELDQMFQQAAQKPDPKTQAAQISAQVAQQKGQIDLQKEQMSAQAQAAAQQADQQERAQDAEAQRANDARQAHLDTLEHEFRMQEIQAKQRTMVMQHEHKQAELRAKGNLKPPPSHARKAKDGNHYVKDPTRPGKYRMVVNG